MLPNIEFYSAPSIGRLDIDNCPKLTSITLQNNTILNHFSITNCPSLTCISGMNRSGLTSVSNLIDNEFFYNFQYMNSAFYEMPNLQ